VRDGFAAGRGVSNTVARQSIEEHFNEPNGSFAQRVFGPALRRTPPAWSGKHKWTLPENLGRRSGTLTKRNLKDQIVTQASPAAFFFCEEIREKRMKQHP